MPALWRCRPPPGRKNLQLDLDRASDYRALQAAYRRAEVDLIWRGSDRRRHRFNALVYDFIQIFEQTTCTRLSFRCCHRYPSSELGCSKVQLNCSIRWRCPKTALPALNSASNGAWQERQISRRVLFFAL